jgi:HAD superfamily hydrolase (TIGR01549 family)
MQIEWCKIKGVFFDAAQTLFDLHPSYAGAFAEVCCDFGYSVSAENVAAVLPAIKHQELERIRRGEGLCVTPETLIERWVNLNHQIFTSVGVDGDAQSLAEEMERRFETGKYSRLYPETNATIALLAKAGYRMGIISNGTVGMKNCIEYLGLNQLMEFVLVSAIEGWEKPAPAMFERAIVLTGLAPDEILFIGDNYVCDIEGAAAVGMGVVYLQRNSKIEIPHNPLSCPVISSLNEILPFLRI